MKTTLSSSNFRAHTKHAEVKIVDRAAVGRIIEPLVCFVLRAGISIRDLNLLVREAAVRTGLEKHHQAALRPNISGIAASTGIPRSEITKILKAPLRRSRKITWRAKTVTQRLLTAWHEHAKYQHSRGLPSDLCVHGRGVSFDALARKYGGGIPTRAILDELILDGSVALLESGLVRLMGIAGVGNPLESQDVDMYREAIADLMSAIFKKIRCPSSPEFITRISTHNAYASALPSLQDISKKCTDLLTDWRTIVDEPSSRNIANTTASKSQGITVTIFFSEVKSHHKRPVIRDNKRKNFRRS